MLWSPNQAHSKYSADGVERGRHCVVQVLLSSVLRRSKVEDGVGDRSETQSCLLDGMKNACEKNE